MDVIRLMKIRSMRSHTHNYVVVKKHGLAFTKNTHETQQLSTFTISRYNYEYMYRFFKHITAIVMQGLRPIHLTYHRYQIHDYDPQA